MKPRAALMIVASVLVCSSAALAGESIASERATLHRGMATPIIAQADTQQRSSRSTSTRSKIKLVKLGVYGLIGLGLAGAWVYKKAMGDGSRTMDEQPLVK